MAIKTFTTGEVLTASDTNTYLANAGLVYVTSTTVGSAVSSVTVSNCFSSTFDNYKVIYTGGVASTVVDIAVRIGNVSTTSYYGSIQYGLFSSNVAYSIGANGISAMQYAGAGDTAFASLDMDILSPYLTKPTIALCAYHASQASGWSQYRLNDTTSYSSFTFLTNTGTLTGGTVTVYGYRKA